MNYYVIIELPFARTNSLGIITNVIQTFDPI